MKPLCLILMCAMVTLARPTLAAEAPANFIIHETPAAIPAVEFQDNGRRPLTLADFKGKVVLLNVWATWCVSCREEMPTLDRLQATLGGPDFEVVALSIDRAGPEAVRKFYTEFGVKHLALYIDESGKANRTLGLIGLPTTLLIDRDGREVGRLIGPAEWDAPEMVAFVRSRLAEK
jgi:thiol-disulfide isomerase/thioredoxin